MNLETDTDTLACFVFLSKGLASIETCFQVSKRLVVVYSVTVDICTLDRFS